MSNQVVLSNDIRRIRQKIELMNKDGFLQIMGDLERMYLPTCNMDNIAKELQARYEKEFEELIEKQMRYKQSKLDL